MIIKPLITFSSNYYFYFKFFFEFFFFIFLFLFIYLFIYFFQFFFTKLSNNFFSMKINNNICLCLLITKNFFRSFWSITFCKNIFLFWYSCMITNCGSSVFTLLNSIHVLDLTPIDFILIALWYVLLLYQLSYWCTHFLILKHYIYKFCSLRF